MPHLVLPLSGCLSRRTPTRATRGEARGHRSVLAQNSLLMYPLPFPSFGLVVGLVCPRHMVGWAPMCLRCCGCIPSLVPFDRVSLGTCGSQKGTQNDGPGCVCVCVVCAWPLGVDVDRRRACPHSRDVGAWYTARCEWCRDPLGHNGSARLCVCVEIALVGPTMVTPEGRGDSGG